MPIVMRPINSFPVIGGITGTLVPVFIDQHTGEIIDRTPQAPEKEKPFSDILKKK